MSEANFNSFEPLPQPVTTKFEDFPDSIESLEEFPLDKPFSQNPRCSDPLVYEFGGVNAYTFRYDVDSGEESLGENMIFVMDVNESDQVEGYGIATRVTDLRSNEIWRIPSVGYTENFEAGKHKGRATRRLRIMNDRCLAEFGMLLHSAVSGNTEPEAAQAWQRLVDVHEAELFEETRSLPAHEHYPRFRFIDKTTLIN